MSLIAEIMGGNQRMLASFYIRIWDIQYILCIHLDSSLNAKDELFFRLSSPNGNYVLWMPVIRKHDIYPMQIHSYICHLPFCQQRMMDEYLGESLHCNS